MLIGLFFGWVSDVLAKLTFDIDTAVYGLAKVVYDVFMFIADARILSDSTAANLTRRVYAILGIFMLFVLAYNLLMYIIDPDRMTDKEKGMSAIIKNVLIALAVMLILPTVFNRLYSLQSTVLKSGVIENLVLGGYTTLDEYSAEGDNSAANGIEKGVNILIANTYAAFLLPDGGDVTVMDCLDTTENKNAPEDYCEAYKKVRNSGYIDEYKDFVTNDDYRYWPLVTTIVGLVLIFFMLSFCLNLAIRAGKLALLQLMAPIPLVLEILPNKQGTRKRWVEALIKTYLEVFIYLAMVYFVIFLISLIPDVLTGLVNSTVGSEKAGNITHLIAIILLSFGLLQFGKSAPGFVYEILGIESKGILKAAGIRAEKLSSATFGGIATAGGIIGSRTIGTGFKEGRKAYKENPALSRGQRFSAAFKAGGSAAKKGVPAAIGGGLIGLGVGGWANKSGGGPKNFKRNTKSGYRDTKLAMSRVTDFREEPNRDTFKNIFTGSTYSRRADKSNKFTQMLDGIQSRKDYPKDNADYSKLNDMYLTEKTKSDYNSVLQRWEAAGAGDERAFAEAISNSDYGTVGWFAGGTTANEQKENVDKLKAAANAYLSKEAKKEEVYDKKQGDIKREAWTALEQIRLNPDLDLNTIDASGNTTVHEKYDNLRELFNEDGSLNLSHSDLVGKTNSEIGRTVDDRFKELTKQIKLRKNEEIDARISDSVRADIRKKQREGIENKDKK